MSTRVESEAHPGSLLSGRRIKLAIPRGVRLQLPDGDFFAFCRANPDLRLERTENGVVEITAPTSGGTGARNAEITAQLVVWAKADGSGVAFDSSTGFRLPGGATRSPDASWVRRDRWDALSEQEREEQFAPLCPDFVIELRSRSDRSKRLDLLKQKLPEYLAQGARLGWLIDPIDGRVEIHRPGRAVEVLDRPARLSGEDVLPRFTLDLTGILFD
jgi:Uma2 family endonuclease